MASRSYRVEAVVRCAHRRSLTVLGFEQVALVASVIFTGSALILITGTQLLSWYWIVPLAIAGAIAAVLRLRGRIPNAYDTAQLLDRRLDLHDTVSTAWHLSRHPELAATAPGRYQLAQAELAAQRVNTTAAIPLDFKRTWALPLALGAVAFALFSVRYLVHRDLDFSRSLIPLRLDRLAARLHESFAAGQNGPADQTDQDGNTEKADAAAAPPSNSRLSDVTGRKAEASPSTSENSTPSQPAPKDVASDNQSDASAGNDAASKSGPGTDKMAAGKESSNSAMKSGSEAGEQRQPTSEPQNGNNGNLMSRMKDAVSSLLAKMKPSEGSQRSSQASARNAATPDQDQTQSETGPSQNQTSAPQSPQSNAKAESKGNEQGQATEMAQSSQSRTSSSAEHSGNDQSKSGIGRQDGGKDLKAAEAQQAMGKLAEIIGKRSQEVSGDMMVEVPSGKQQLKTAYSGKLAEHSDDGGEINRDEIPLIFQQYIREYMERVHREAPAPAATPTKR